MKNIVQSDGKNYFISRYCSKLQLKCWFNVSGTIIYLHYCCSNAKSDYFYIDLKVALVVNLVSRNIQHYQVSTILSP